VLNCRFVAQTQKHTIDGSTLRWYSSTENTFYECLSCVLVPYVKYTLSDHLVYFHFDFRFQDTVEPIQSALDTPLLKFFLVLENSCAHNYLLYLFCDLSL
jgi:hypothetical protein